MIDTRKILLSTAMFVMSMVGAGAQSAADIHDINVQIHNARAKIDKLRAERAKCIKKTLNRNSDYRYVSDHAREIATLRRDNENLIAHACEIVRRKKLPAFVIVPQSAMVFMLYSEYSEVRSLHGIYEFNCRQISIYNHRLKKIDGFETRVTNRHDSIMHAEIDKYQLAIDSLLNEKMRLVR